MKQALILMLFGLAAASLFAESYDVVDRYGNRYTVFLNGTTVTGRSASGLVCSGSLRGQTMYIRFYDGSMAAVPVYVPRTAPVIYGSQPVVVQPQPVVVERNPVVVMDRQVITQAPSPVVVYRTGDPVQGTVRWASSAYASGPGYTCYVYPDGSVRIYQRYY